MALTHLLDTSVLKRARSPKIDRVLESMDAGGTLGRATVSDLDDADFDRIAAVTGQRCEWVVPAGSIE